ncbi:probable BOI-related E3 ubiquitin-protein ligase 2 [Typha latifolia]|uniref:probable BOI-related E3 ubiquitin-protein ligase 2 n=1 Tax=Typha latifolia TaxID=4733 RepID=UPI003C2F52DA
MAVEAHHLRLFPSQLLKNRAILENQPNTYNSHMGLAPPVSAAFCSPAGSVSRKRSRDAAFSGEDISSHIQQHMLDVDRLILNHSENVLRELMERRRRLSRQVLAAAEQQLAKRLKAKEEEIERIAKLNWALEERIRSLCIENQIWRELAQTNEATANMLRNNLEQALAAAQVNKVKEEEERGEDVDDAESCCCGDNNNLEEEEDEDEERRRSSSSRRRKRACKNCGGDEPAVLLLPCRHLCLCAACGPVVDTCPVCNCHKNGSVIVNLS